MGELVALVLHAAGQGYWAVHLSSVLLSCT